MNLLCLIIILINCCSQVGGTILVVNKKIDFGFIRLSSLLWLCISGLLIQNGVEQFAEVKVLQDSLCLFSFTDLLRIFIFSISPSLIILVINFRFWFVFGWTYTLTNIWLFSICLPNQITQTAIFLFFLLRSLNCLLRFGFNRLLLIESSS